MSVYRASDSHAWTMSFSSFLIGVRTAAVSRSYLLATKRPAVCTTVQTRLQRILRRNLYKRCVAQGFRSCGRLFRQTSQSMTHQRCPGRPQERLLIGIRELPSAESSSRPRPLRITFSSHDNSRYRATRTPSSTPGDGTIMRTAPARRPDTYCLAVSHESVRR